MPPSLPSGQASCGSSSDAQFTRFAHGQWCGIGGHPALLQGCHGVASISLQPPPTRRAGGCRAAPRRVVMGERAWYLAAGKSPQNCTSFPAGAPEPSPQTKSITPPPRRLGGRRSVSPRSYHRPHMIFAVCKAMAFTWCILPAVSMPRASKLSSYGSYHWNLKREQRSEHWKDWLGSSRARFVEPGAPTWCCSCPRWRTVPMVFSGVKTRGDRD